MRGNDFVPASKLFSNAAAGTSAQFELRGGKYALDWIGTSAGTLALNRLGPDGVTFVLVAPSVGSALTGTGSSIYDLPPGQYQVVIATSTANYVSITEIQIGG